MNDCNALYRRAAAHQRRALLIGAGWTALALQAVRAQGAVLIARIGVLRWGSADDFAEIQRGLGAALSAAGWQERRNLAIEWRYAPQIDGLARHAEELRALKLDLVVGSTTPAAVALVKAGITVPIVLGTTADPLRAGLVRSLAQPGGNVTGVSSNLVALVGKQVQLLQEVMPGLQRLAFLGSNQDAALPAFLAEFRAAVSRQRLKGDIYSVDSPDHLDAAADAMQRAGVQAVVVQPLFALGDARAPALLMRRRLVSISGLPPYAKAGGPLVYGPDREAAWRRVAYFVDRILKGAEPGSLPVEEPNTYELIVNNRALRQLGLVLPRLVQLQVRETLE